MATVEDQAEQDAAIQEEKLGSQQRAETNRITGPAPSRQQGRPQVTVPPVERRRSTSSPDRAKTADEWRQRQGLTGLDAYYAQQRRAQSDHAMSTMMAGGKQTSSAPAAPATQPAIQATATGSVGARSTTQPDPDTLAREQAALNALRPYSKPLGDGVAMRSSDGSVKFESGATITPTGTISTTGTGNRALASRYGTGSVTYGSRTPPPLTAAAPTVSPAPAPPSATPLTPQATTAATTLPKPPTAPAPAASAPSPGVATWQPDVDGWKRETQAKLDASRAQTASPPALSPATPPPLMRTPLQTAGIKLQGGAAHAAEAYTAPARAAGQVVGAAGDLAKTAVGVALGTPKNVWKWANTPRPVAP